MTTKESVSKFAEEGYLVLENFIDDDTVAAMKAECHKLIDDMDPKQHHTTFSTITIRHNDDYFIKSADRIGFFFEEGAMDEEGNLRVDKHLSVNKIGHALHVLCPAFRKVTFQDRIKDILKNLDYKDPTVMQSMYIFKQPGIGGLVVPHQDGTYLYVEPLKVMGIWIALEDATLDNGCLWFIPGSHKKGLFGDYRMVKNPDADKTGKTCMYIGEKPDYDSMEDYVPVPVKKGTCILIDGLVIHKSKKNTSANSRHIYTFHVYDAAGTWSDRNWLQPTPANTFSHVYEM